MSLPLLHAGKSAPGLSAALDLRFALDKSLTAYRGPTPSFSRASTGTYFNSSGVLTTAAINGARFSHTFNGTSWVSRGLLVEEQRSNISTYSEDFSNAAWTLYSSTISSNAIVAPDGNATADALVENSSNIEHFIYQVPGPVVSSGSKYVMSVFAKKGSRDWLFLGSGSSAAFGSGTSAYFNLANGTVGTLGAAVSSATIADVGNGWYRCCIFLTAIATTNAYQAIGAANVNGTLAYQGNGSTSIYIWGCQLEAGSFPTSYIGTTNSSVVRSADVCQITGSDFSGFWNQNEGSIVAEWDTYSASSPQMVASASAAANPANNFIAIRNEIFYGYVSGADQFSLAYSVTSNTPNKVSGAYKTNDFAASLNGAAVLTDTTGTLPTQSQFDIGQTAAYSTSPYKLNGHIARLRYYRKRLPNATLQQLST